MTTAIERLRAALVDGEWTAEDRRADALRALAEIEAEWERLLVEQTAPRPALTEEEARAWRTECFNTVDIDTIPDATFNTLADAIDDALLRASRGDIPAEVRAGEPSPEQQILQAMLDVSAPDRTNNAGAEQYRRCEAQARLDALRAQYPSAFNGALKNMHKPTPEMAVTTGEDPDDERMRIASR